jgi:outer membrane protein assembly factor BamB
VGSRDKALHVLDLRTGTLQWTFETQGKIDSSPVIEGSRDLLSALTTAEFAASTSKHGRVSSHTRQVRP